MPTEQRKIILAPAETQQAIDSFRRTNPDVMPAGSMKGFFLNGSAEEVELVISLGGFARSSQPVSDFILKGHQLTSMLIKFCLENNIPVPRSSKRFSCLHGDRLALSIEYATECLTE
jgi:hypothetical protein